MVPLALLLLATAAPPHRFLHLLHEVPVGEVELRREGPRYEYVSRQFFGRGKISEQRFTPAAPADREWASESLLQPRPVGCWPVEDELTHARGEACFTQAGPKARGTLLGQPFTAVYERGQLQQLALGASQFVRNRSPAELTNPFLAGFQIRGEGGERLAVSPAVPGARAATVRGAGAREDCLAAANEWVKSRGDEWDLVLGLIEDEGRGWPHAWVRHRVSGEEVDPSRPQAAEEAPRYLALPREKAAPTYLDLLGKLRALVRVAAQ